MPKWSTTLTALIPDLVALILSWFAATVAPSTWPSSVTQWRAVRIAFCGALGVKDAAGARPSVPMKRS